MFERCSSGDCCAATVLVFAACNSAQKVGGREVLQNGLEIEKVNWLGDSK